MCSPCKKDTRHAGNVKTADLCQHIDGIGRIRLIDGNCFFNRCNFPRKTFTRKPGAPSRQFRNRLIQETAAIALLVVVFPMPISPVAIS